MEASSLTFGGNKSPAALGPKTERLVSPDPAPQPEKEEQPVRHPAPSRGVPSPHAPAVSISLRFIVTGMLSFFTGATWLVFRPDILASYHYNQYVIAVTHLFTLGWITSIIMGAMYQLVPVALETKLYSERLARRQFILHLIGFTGMVWMFWIWDMKQVGHFGSIMGVGIGVFVYNIARTLKTIPRWNVIAAAIASALFWLSFTLLAGLYLSAAKCWAFSPFDPMAQMHAHAHLGVVGFMLMMIVGVSYKLVPMFTLGEMQKARRAWWSIGLLNVGLLALTVAILGHTTWKPAAALVIVAGLAVFGWEIWAILRARKRRVLDWGLTYFLTALGLLAVVGGVGVFLSRPSLKLTPFTGQLENVYGLLALLSVVSLAILGMLYKIVPFLVWYSSYSSEVGRRKVPALADLYSARLQAVGYWLFVGGLGMVCAATLLGRENAVQWSCAVLLSGLAVFAVNMAKILMHLVRPATEPLTRKIYDDSTN